MYCVNRHTASGQADNPTFRQIKVSSLFTDYRIQSNSNNEITISMSSEALLAALRSAAASSTAQNSSTSFTTDTQVTMKSVTSTNAMHNDGF